MAQRNQHKRAKHGAVPGDLPKRVKIKMREDKQEIVVSPWHKISRESCQQYQRELAKKAKKVNRRRLDREAGEQLNDN